MSVCGTGLFAGQLERNAQLLWILARISMWFAIAGYLHYIKWYWSL